MLLSGWAAGSSLSSAWLSLDARDDEPKRLWSLVGDALLAAGIVGETDGFSALTHARTDASSFLTALLNSIPGPAQHVLIIDDAHHLTDPTILAELDAIVRYGFPQLRLILSSRSDPLLPLHRYRLAGQMHELRAADLAMTKTEAHALMSAHGVRLPSRALALLTARTEGWAAGLRLSAMRMAQSKHPAQFVTQLALDQGSVGEYLMEEVLDRQPERVRRLLIQTSFLDEVTGPLAAAVTGIDESGALLAELSRTNSFVVPLDRDDDRYRYHQLLSEILHHLLKREYPEQIDALRRRAAAWYEQQDDLSAAMRFAAEAQDWSRVCTLLIHGGFARAFVERRDLIDLGLGRLGVLDPSQVGGREEASDVLVAQVAVAVAAGADDDATARLREFHNNSSNSDAQITAGLVEVMAAQRAGHIGRLDQVSDLLLKERPGAFCEHPALGLRAAIRLGQSNVHYWADDRLFEVQALAQDALEDAQRSGVVGLQLESLGMLELIHVTAGRLTRAKDCHDRSRALTKEFPRLRRGTTHHLAHAYGSFLRGDLAGAERALKLAEQTKTLDADHWLRAGVDLTRAWMLIAADAVADAHQLLSSSPDLQIPLPSRLARSKALLLAGIETRLGRPNAALKAMNSNPGEPKEPMQAMMTARAELVLGDAIAAERALRPVLIATENQTPLPILVIALLMSAEIAQLKGDDAKAVEEIVRATQLATEAILQPFVDARPALRGVLSRHAEARDAWPATARVTIPSQPVANSNHPAPSLAQALTERETAVLRRLATTMTTSEIADELCVSINTVKTHIAAIYRKLPAAGRRDAVTRARQLELL
ncbi:MAG: hypothetical protein JWN96_3987 [Mycobacterium sp.]|nr:hypothetical protein [Mycobacterium sp.]